MDEAMRYANGLRIGRAWVDSARTAKASDAAPSEQAATTLATESFSALPEASDASAALADVEPAVALGRTAPDPVRGPALDPDGSPRMPRAAATLTGITPNLDVPQLAPMRGITVGAVNAPPVGPQTAAMRRSIGGQATAAAMFLVALAPPIVTALLLGLSHRAHAIPAAAVWAWMAALIALGITVRSSVVAAARAAATWLSPVLLSVLLLVPAVVVLYLRLTLSPVPMRLAVVQVVLYGIALVALLITLLTESAE